MVAILLFAAGQTYADDETPTAAPQEKPPVIVAARVEPGVTTIGTPIRYVVTIDSPKDLQLVIPLLGDRFADFYVTDFGDEPPKEENGRVKVVRWFKLVGYSPGDFTLPAYPLKFREPGGELRDAQGNEVNIIVRSLLAKEPTPLDIRDIAAPEEPPFDWRPVLIAGGGLLALGVVAAAIAYFVRRRRSAEMIPVPKPHEVALAALRRLHARHLLEKGDYEKYYVELTSIVRAYVEGRFGLHAPEMTTEEFLVAMRNDRRLSPEHRTLLGAFLSESDLVKFARHTPAVEDGERAYVAAQRFVDESREGFGLESPSKHDGQPQSGEGSRFETKAQDGASDVAEL